MAYPHHIKPGRVVLLRLITLARDQFRTDRMCLSADMQNETKPFSVRRRARSRTRALAYINLLAPRTRRAMHKKLCKSTRRKKHARARANTTSSSLRHAQTYSTYTHAQNPPTCAKLSVELSTYMYYTAILFPRNQRPHTQSYSHSHSVYLFIFFTSG